jgi:translation elongation factor EF-G
MADNSEKIKELMKDPINIRNIAIAAHYDLA